MFGRIKRREGVFSQVKNLTFLPLVVGLLLAGCAEEDARLVGEKIPLLPPAQEVKSFSSKERKPTLPEARVCHNWPQFLNNPEHVVSHCRGVREAQPWSLNEAIIEVSVQLHPPIWRGRMEFVSPVAEDGHIYVQIASERVESIAIDDLPKKPRKARWITDLSELDQSATKGEGGGLALSETAVFATNGLKNLYALERESGDLLWQTELPEPVQTAPLVAKNYVYVKGVNGSLSAYDTTYGFRVWSSLDSDPAGVKLLSGSTPAFASQTRLGYQILVAGIADGRIIALRSDTGSKVWEYSHNPSTLSPVIAITDIGTSPLIYGQSVIVGNLSNGLVALNLYRGSILWQQPLDLRRTPWLSGDTLFLVTDQSALYALSAEDGRSFWSAALDDPEEDEIWFTPLHYNGTLLVFSSSGLIKQFDPMDGTLLAERSVDALPSSDPLVVEGKVMIPTQRGRFLSLY